MRARERVLLAYEDAGDVSTGTPIGSLPNQALALLRGEREADLL